MKAAIYARESSDDTTKAPPITEQIARAEAYAKENNIELAGIYADNGFSGGDWKRPEWNRLIADARFHRFGLVLTWAQDRLARDTEQFLSFYRRLKEAHVVVYSLTEGAIDMESLGGRVKHTTLAMAAEIFRVTTSEKVRKTYAAKKKAAELRGQPLAWGRKPAGFDAAKVMELRSQGNSIRACAAAVGCSRQTILRILKASQKPHAENNPSQEGFNPAEQAVT